MCDPVTIGGALLMGASTAMNSAAQRRVQNARDDALAAERIRQRGYDAEAAGVNTQAQDRYRDFSDQQSARSGELAEFFRAQETAEPSAADALPASSSNITVREEAKQRGAARERTDQIGTALGDLRAFGDLLGGISRLQGRDAATIGQIGGFKRGSQGVLDYELMAANDKGSGLRTFADLAGGLGSIGLTSGLSRGPSVKAGAPAQPGMALNMSAPNLYSMYG